MSNDIRKLQALSASYQVAFEAATQLPASELRRGELAKLRGRAIFLDRVSANGRKYNAQSVHAQVRLLQPRVAAKALFGELDHPRTDDLNRLAYVQMQNVSHRIDAIWWDDKEQVYWIEVTILDTPNGRILKAILDAGSPLYVSLRSLLDPAKNRQMPGYVDAWMMALITIDFVSQPGFSDAVLEPIAIANESMIAVCESLDLTKQLGIEHFNNNYSTSQSERMQNKRKMYGIIVANENVTGVTVEPAKSVTDLANKLVANLRESFPGKFTENDFIAKYSGLFDGYQLGLYATTAQIALVKADDQTTVTFALDKVADGEFKMPETVEFKYVDSESSPIESNKEPAAATEMYQVLEPAAIVATENWSPTEDFTKLATDVLGYMRANHGSGFDMTDCRPIVDAIKEQFDADLTIAHDNDDYKLVVTKDGAKAVINLTVAGNAAIADEIAEYSEIAPLAAKEGVDIPPQGGTHIVDKLTGTQPEGVQAGKPVDENDDKKAAEQQHVNDQMYEIVDGLQPEQEPSKPAEPQAKKDDKEASKTSDSISEIAEEAARIFGMPNSKWAGNYAIEHMPTAYKHLWASASEAARCIIAKRAQELQVATEAETIKFFANVDFVGIERAVVFSKNAEAGLESFKPVDTRAAFLNQFVART